MKITRISARRLVSEPGTFGHKAIEITAEIEEGDDPSMALYQLKQRVDAEVLIYGTETAPPPPATQTVSERERHPQLRFRWGRLTNGGLGWGTPENPCIEEDDIPF